MQSKENLNSENMLCLIGAYYQRFKIVLAKGIFSFFYHATNREKTHVSFYTPGKINEL